MNDYNRDRAGQEAANAVACEEHMWAYDACCASVKWCFMTDKQAEAYVEKTKPLTKDYAFMQATEALVLATVAKNFKNEQHLMLVLDHFRGSMKTADLMTKYGYSHSFVACLIRKAKYKISVAAVAAAEA